MRFLHVFFIISSVRRFWNEVCLDVRFNSGTWLIWSNYCDREWCCEHASCVVCYAIIFGIMVMAGYNLFRLIQYVDVRFGS